MSVGYRMSAYDPQPEMGMSAWLPYPGCKADVEVFQGAFSNSSERGLVRLWLPIATIDLPFSFVIDTLCSPYDLWRLYSTPAPAKTHQDKQPSNQPSEATR